VPPHHGSLEDRIRRWGRRRPRPRRVSCYNKVFGSATKTSSPASPHALLRLLALSIRFEAMDGFPAGVSRCNKALGRPRKRASRGGHWVEDQRMVGFEDEVLAAAMGSRSY
jgi:hypothetical protein